jgi:putative transposase
VIYAFIRDHKGIHSVDKMARILQIHRSAYYRWLKGSESRTLKRRSENILIHEIKSIQEKTRFSYGEPRITDALNCIEGISINHKKVSRLLRENGLNKRVKRKFRHTTDSNHTFKKASNILNRKFSSDSPNQKWVSDFTYIWTNEGWLYLCVIIDLFSRKIVGWSTSQKIDTDLLLSSFWQAMDQRKPKNGLLFHSDRGVQYCANRFRNALESKEFIQSMSRKGNCWDNACAESFFKSLKGEWLLGAKFNTRKEAKELLFDYIEIFYNRQRSHSFLNYETPEKFELNFVA